MYYIGRTSDHQTMFSKGHIIIMELHGALNSSEAK